MTQLQIREHEDSLVIFWKFQTPLPPVITRRGGLNLLLKRHTGGKGVTCVLLIAKLLPKGSP